ncbi:tripartite tricarboxylate transporter substrate binding protein [Variovorax sp. J22G73]|uniref:tripartite tricarboxylate transporter substrate binding protein n=1 Tax=unclassified Variovorax TaxID=663243 RepID=UPI000D5E8C17|nr:MULTISPECIES: tripartite tricarboxylate transporter substrate binding protein [unclassified Variovorax]MDM0008707.1 tripartite tricarboxylate transporter substrate binding protein [Variovorax sp. J22R203]MDM0101214.1 tripartite tricarboxylate transporter substrate binding protein [Variovorax sp. J22G73]
MNASFEVRHRRTVRRVTLLTLSLGTTLGISLGLVATAPAFAQQQPAAWPARPISLVVPFPAGGTTDVLARALADKLSQSLGQPVVVESKPGAGATLGADYVAKAKPDGYTLLMGAVHHTIATSVYKKLPYDFQKDLAPITVVAMVPNVLVVNAALTPAKNVAELVALAKAAPDKLAYGSNGNGTAQHLIGTQFQASTGTTLLHVPYKGSGPLTTDLLGGQVAMSFDTIMPVLQHIKGGKLRALAVTTARRSSVLPDVPTLEEAGLKGFDIGTWFGVLAPAATPKEVVARLNAEMVKIIRSPDFAQRMQAIGAEPLGGTPEEMARQIRDETARFARLVKDGGVAIE